MGVQQVMDEFVDVVKTLRGEQGCPWDRAQTHDSLRPCTMEEAAELAAAIRIYQKTGDPENMKEELGDLLLQVVMHAQIAEEEGLFTLEEVIRAIHEKMIRRHPHVFAGEQISGEDRLVRWEEIKKKEKEGKSWISSPLREIPCELPSLARAAKVIKKVDRLYPSEEQEKSSITKLEESVAQLKGLEAQADQAAMEECIGEILWCVSEISARRGIPQEQVLSDRIEDVIDSREALHFS